MPDLHRGTIPQSGKTRQGDRKDARGSEKANGNVPFRREQIDVQYSIISVSAMVHCFYCCFSILARWLHCASSMSTQLMRLTKDAMESRMSPPTRRSHLT